MRAYHLTSENHFEKIRTTGFLLPVTVPVALSLRVTFPSLEDVIENNKEFFWQKYVVSGLSEDFHEWKENGLYLDLLKQILKDPYLRCVKELNKLLEKYSGKIKCLSFDLDRTSKGFVLDHYHISPANSILVYGINIWNPPLDVLISEREKLIEIGEELWFRYYESATPLLDYEGNFKTPELWIPEQMIV